MNWKTNIMWTRFKRVVGWTIAAILSLAYSIIGGTYAFLVVVKNLQSGFFPVIVCLFFCLLIACCVVAWRWCRKRNLDAAGHGRALILAALILPLLFLTRDAPPMETDLVAGDVLSRDPNILASYDTLMALGRTDKLKVIPTYIDDALANPLPHAVKIDEAWKDIAPLREVIRRLDSYPGITDATPQHPPSVHSRFTWLMDFRQAVRVYNAYALLRASQGNPSEGARELVQLQRVTRKGLPPATMLINKMVFIAATGRNIHTAHRMIEKHRCDPKTLRLLKEGFPPLTQEETSLRLPVLAEYLMAKDLLNSMHGGEFLDVFLGKTKKPDWLWKLLSTGVYHLTFQKNRTLRLEREFIDLLSQGLDKRPPDLSAAGAFRDQHILPPTLRNTSGGVFNSFFQWNFFQIIKRTMEAKILSDLLAMEIHERLGEKLGLADPYTGQPYLRDGKTGRCFSPGLDRQNGTEDDVFLGKE